MSAWVLLRGLSRDSRHWRDFAGQFRQAFPEADVLCIDLPGTGQFHRQASPTRMADIAAHCRRVAWQSGVAPPYHLLAISLGAMVAVEWARAAPHELCAGVLLSASLRPISPFYRRLRWRNYPAILRLFARTGELARRERTILDLTSNRADRQSLLPEWLAWQREAPASARNILRQLYAAAAYRAPPAAPAVPMLLLASRADRLVHYSCSTGIARRWDAPCRLHGTAGHDLPLDDGRWVLAQIDAWLRAGPARQRPNSHFR